ncbi:MAG: hypothetical protein QOI95_3000 [Acidimicrobiaceae bacterium]
MFAVVALLALVSRGGDDRNARVQATGNGAQSFFSGSTTTSAITVPDVSTSTLPTSDSVPVTSVTTPTTRAITTTLPLTTQPPTTQPTTTQPPGIPAGYARIEIVNGLDRTVVVHLDSVGAIDTTLGPGGSRAATDMAVTDDHADTGKVQPPGELCGSGGVQEYFSEGHRYRVTVTTWNGSAEGGPCAAEPTPMLVLTDLDTGATKTIG